MAISEDGFRFAYRLYVHDEDASGGMQNQWRVGESLGFERHTTQKLSEELKNEGLLELLSFEGDVALTSFGTAAVMQALADVDQGTVYFPPVAELIDDTPGGRQLITLDSVHHFIDSITVEAEKLLLDEDSRLELETGIAMLEQYLGDNPDRVAPLRDGLEKVCKLLSPDHPL